MHIEKNIRNELVSQALDDLNSCFSVSAVRGLASPRVGEEGGIGISQLISLVYPVLCPLRSRVDFGLLGSFNQFKEFPLD